MNAETPYERLKRQMAYNDAADEHIPIHVHFSEAACSDPRVMELIGWSIENKVPFGLARKGGWVMFIVGKLHAWSVNEKGITGLEYKHLQLFIAAVKLTYLTHKEFVPADKLLEMYKILINGK